jgi:hypothetical protein
MCVVFFLLGEDRVWILYDGISEYSICSIFIGRALTQGQWRWRNCSETWAHKIQTLRITQKEEHNIQNTAEFWNQDVVFESISIVQNIKSGNVIYKWCWEEAFKCRMLRPCTLAYTQYVGELRTCSLRVELRLHCQDSEDYLSLTQKNWMKKFTYYFFLVIWITRSKRVDDEIMKTF